MAGKAELVKKLRDMRAVDSLILLPDNPRQGDIGAISQSLERFGQQKPIVVNRDGVILAGNHTFQAAKALGWEEIWVAESELEGSDQPGFALADNRLSDLATYDHDALLRYLEEQPDLTGTGYDLDDLEEVREQIAFEKADNEDRDERFTPPWLFEAMNVRFDVDLAAPTGGLSYIPADAFYTKDDDALLHDWADAFVWCNPPYSVASQFGAKWNAEVKEGVWLGPVSHSAQYWVDMTRAAVLIWLPTRLEFSYRNEMDSVAFPVFLGGFGSKGEEALRNLHSNAGDRGILLAVL